MSFPLSGKDSAWLRITLLLGVMCAAVCFRNPNDFAGLAPIFRYLFFVQDRPASLVALAVAMVAVVAVDRDGKMQAFLRWVAMHPGWLAAATLVSSALGAWFVYHNHPLSMDEYAAYMQSQIFAAGHLAGQVPPKLVNELVPVGFQGHFIHASRDTGAVASAYWPGLALVMAPFSFAGVPWLCNPVLTALTLLALARLLEELVEDVAARGFALFATVASPVILINGMSYYGMPLQLLCAVMFTLGMVRGTPRQMLAAVAWAVLGMMAVNPFPLMLYALPWLIWVFFRMPHPWRKLGLLALAGLPLALLLGVGWRVFLLGNFHNAGPMHLGSDIGSMLGVFKLPTMSLLLARVIALVKLCLWAVPGLPVLAVAAYLYRKKYKWIEIFTASAVISLAGYLFVPADQGHGWGYRYFHAAWLVLPVLAAVALQHIAADPALRQRAYGFAFATCLGTLALSLPLRVYQVESFISTQLQQIPARLTGNSRQAVFIDMGCGFYTADLVQNDPLFRSNEIRLVGNSHAGDAKVATMLGAKPRLVATGPCGRRWLLD